ncbi:MAG TPA: aminotransferase class V-fold PLP-dependent enzyme [Planctomycetes bacterium]|nr:aminotransferase class V-fold PLP-dependent enzyme [Fuerstiella sp.]HIK95695.1 aminotransferase class V-fold PLP-dependent enzyme [Planctomycetota bacterium]
MSHETAPSEIPALVASSYGATVFDDLSKVWQKCLAEHLRSVMAGETAVLNWQEPVDAIADAEALLHSGGVNPLSEQQRGHKFESLLQKMLASGQNLHHPRYIGHQVPASIPVAGLFDAVGSLTNQPSAIYEMGPWATAVEHAVTRSLCRKVGWDPATSFGVFTHGGSLANLTALLTARNVVFPDSWEHGLPQNAVLVAHSDSHYCITRSAGILGLGTRQVVKAKLDHRRRMDPNELNQLLAAQKAADRKILAVCACACATPIGVFDPLQEVAAVCRDHDVWLHVDAAHGGAALMSRTHRHLLAGIDSADSVVWDAHKMLFVPATCAAVLYRDRAHRFQTFQQDAPYLFDPSNPGMAEFDNGTRTVECTKRSTGFALWGIWALYGEEIFEQLVDRTFALGQYFHQRLTGSDDFEVLHTPECNIVVFRYVPMSLRGESVDVLDGLQQEIRSRLVKAGDFYIVQTNLDGHVALRITVMNPLTTEQDLVALLDELRAIGQDILCKQP